MKAKTLGDYSLIKPIGQGSLGTVFFAEHRFLKSSVAIKVLPEDLTADRGFVQRFEKDVTTLATLDHPNIVKVHNISFSDGQYFLVTDCIVDSLGETTNLAQYLSLNEKPLTEEELVRIAHQVASALDYAHQRTIGDENFVHKGIKLNNILVGASKEGIQVYLSDFGLSKIAGTASILTRTYKGIAEAMAAHTSAKLAKLNQTFLQNFAFLAPEQKVFDEQQVDQKADIYAFGVLIYYLITREYPEGIFDLPSTFAPELKLNWDLLVTHCLQKNPLKRPESLKSALEELLQVSVNEKPKPVLKPQEIRRPEFDADPGAIFQTESIVARYQPKNDENRNIEPLLTEMIVIRGGRFLQGSNHGGRDEMPRHEIVLSSFAIDIHPVTNEQFVRFLEAMGGEKDANNNDIIRLRDSRIKRSGGKLSIESGYAKHPVVGVAWYGAVAYAKWVGKRLPTEAEWEIAACAGVDDCLYPTGSNIERSQANFFSSDTTAVMSYPANNYGLYDMSGNVYEWCQDWYDYHYYDLAVQEPDNPKGPLQGVYRILRGGCWKSLKEDMRCAHRHRNNPGTMNGTYGFRCAADVL